MEKEVLKEHERLENILDRANVPRQKREALAPIVDNLAWMKVKLDETRKVIKNGHVVCAYDNGGNQRGIHESPLFKGYLSLWKGYLAGLEKFCSVLPEEMQEETEAETLTILDQVREMKRAAK